MSRCDVDEMLCDCARGRAASVDISRCRRKKNLGDGREANDRGIIKQLTRDVLRRDGSVQMRRDRAGMARYAAATACIAQRRALRGHLPRDGGVWRAVNATGNSRLRVTLCGRQTRRGEWTGAFFPREIFGPFTQLGYSCVCLIACVLAP